MLSNFDDIFNYAYFSANITNDPTLFPDGRGNYAELNATGIGSADYGWYNGGRGVNLDSVQWMPVANLNDPVADYVVKFEMQTKLPWSNGTIYLATRWISVILLPYIARYEPWLNADGSVDAFCDAGMADDNDPAIDL